jgi:hypothetical protein
MILKDHRFILEVRILIRGIPRNKLQNKNYSHYLKAKIKVMENRKL